MSPRRYAQAAAVLFAGEALFAAVHLAFGAPAGYPVMAPRSATAIEPALTKAGLIPPTGRHVSVLRSRP